VELRAGTGRVKQLAVRLVAGRTAKLRHVYPAVPAGSRGTLVVRSTPPAKVTLDDEAAGQTPLRQALVSRSYLLKLETKDGRTHQRTVFPEPGGDTVEEHVFPTAEAPPTPDAEGRLSVECDPRAEVVLQGKRLGITPFKGATIPAGKHRVTLRTEDGREHHADVTIVVNRTTSFQYRFPPVEERERPTQVGHLTVTASQDATVTIDGRLAGATPLVSFEVAKGNHRVVVVSKVGRKRRTVSVHVPAGIHRTLHLRF
jgi:hypothetical protein